MLSGLTFSRIIGSSVAACAFGIMAVDTLPPRFKRLEF
jgi:hypothetical protein